MVYLQLVEKQRDGNWSTLDSCYILSPYGVPTDSDIANANELASKIRGYSRSGSPIAMLDGAYEGSIAGKLAQLNMGRVIVGFPPDGALMVLANLVGIHPLELGQGGDVDELYRFRLDDKCLHGWQKEANKWMTSDPQTR